MMGFVSRHASGRVYRVLAERAAIDTDFMTEIEGRTPFTHFFPSGSKSVRVGPTITVEEKVNFFNQVLSILAEVDRRDPPLIILSGSIPRFEDGSDVHFYSYLINLIRSTQSSWAKQSAIWVDSKWRRGMESALHAHPDYAKCNHIEFSEIPDCACSEKSRLMTYARQIQKLAAKFNLNTVGVTLGARGALGVRDGSMAEYVHLRTKIINPEPAGCGDTFFAVQAAHRMHCLPSTFSHFSDMEVAVAAAAASARKSGTNLVSSVREVVAETRHLVSHRFIVQ
jgi:fructose-1-phosphate kinase PfkB-like protein